MNISHLPAHDQGAVPSDNSRLLPWNACLRDLSICILCSYYDRMPEQHRECFLSLESAPMFGRLHPFTCWGRRMVFHESRWSNGHGSCTWGALCYPSRIALSKLYFQHRFSHDRDSFSANTKISINPALHSLLHPNPNRRCQYKNYSVKQVHDLNLL